MRICSTMNGLKVTMVLRFTVLLLGASILACVPVVSQTDDTRLPSPVPAQTDIGNSATPVNDNDNGNRTYDDRMQTPPPVSGEAYPTELVSEERSNFLRGRLSFTSAYMDNALPSLNGRPVSDISYSVAPYVRVDETTSRMHAALEYAPGFTFYQRLNARNDAGHNASIDFQYRLSPHVTFLAHDDFLKSSNIFNQLTVSTSQPVSGGAQEPNLSVIAPVADLLSNSGSLGIRYQFARNSMIGANGTFFDLHYPNPAQVPGLYDAGSQGGSAFYSFRISRRHYIGANYQYQRLMAYPVNGITKTQTHTLLFVYTIYPTLNFSISFFAGPQHADTIQPPRSQAQSFPELRQWSPAAGASLSWQGRSNSFAISYSHVISGGGGLTGAVEMDNATGAIRQRMSKTLTASVSGSYVRNNLLGPSLIGDTNGHSTSATALLEQQVGQHWSVQLGYSRIHQTYSNVAAVSLTPSTNREFVSVSYQFLRPLGR